MPLIRHTLLPAVVFAVATFSVSAFGQTFSPPSPAAVAEARDRFQRGVDLSDEGNQPAAMAEFQRAYQLTHNPLVLFNISATHEASGQYVQALDAMLQYVALAPPEAVAARRPEVDAALQRLQGRVGRIVVRTDLPGLEVRIDGLVRPTPEAHQGARVSAGTHRVVLIAPNYESGEREVVVAGGATVEVDATLSPTRSSIGIDCNVPGAEVLIDGGVMAVTPAESPIGVAEGLHHVVVRRAGYTSYETDVNSIGNGAHVVARLTWAEASPSGSTARMVLHANVPDCVAMIDGRRVSTDGSDPVPPGPHRLRVERQDYLAEERDIDLPAGRTTPLEVFLLPTPAYEESYRAHARSVRTAGWALTLTGVALATAGAVVFYINNGNVTADAALRDSLGPALAANLHTAGYEYYLNSYNNLNDQVGNLTTVNIIALAAAGAGIVTAAIGIGVLATAPSSNHFERRASIRFVPGYRSVGLAIDF